MMIIRHLGSRAARPSQQKKASQRPRHEIGKVFKKIWEMLKIVKNFNKKNNVQQRLQMLGKYLFKKSDSVK